jgi:hypothetical protein
MQEHIDVGKPKPRGLKHLSSPLDHGALRRTGRGEHLERLESPPRLQHDIRERTPDIGGKPNPASM